MLFLAERRRGRELMAQLKAMEEQTAEINRQADEDRRLYAEARADEYRRQADEDRRLAAEARADEDRRLAAEARDAEYRRQADEDRRLAAEALQRAELRMMEQHLAMMTLMVKFTDVIDRNRKPPP